MQLIQSRINLMVCSAVHNKKIKKHSCCCFQSIHSFKYSPTPQSNHWTYKNTYIKVLLTTNTHMHTLQCPLYTKDQHIQRECIHLGPIFFFKHLHLLNILQLLLGCKIMILCSLSLCTYNTSWRFWQTFDSGTQTTKEQGK